MVSTIPISAAQEMARLQALQPYKSLESTRNEVFEKMAQLTARLFGVPMAQLSLVDAEIVTYPGNVGQPKLADRLARADSICAVAVYQPNQPTIFPDLRAQPCQWVSAEAQKDVAFYASYPIQTKTGQAIGALCVLDKKPHEFNTQQQLILRRLAGIAIQLLDLQLVAAPEQSPVLWAAITARVQLSLQRIDTLTALARWEPAPDTAAAQSYQLSMHEERLLIVQDIEYEAASSLARVRRT